MFKVINRDNENRIIFFMSIVFVVGLVWNWATLIVPAINWTYDSIDKLLETPIITQLVETSGGIG